MTLWAFPMLTTLWLIVDRIEGDYTIVEWENMALSSVHSSLLPRETKEGSRLKLTLLPSPLGDWYAVHNDPSILQGNHPLIIPIKDVVSMGLYYHYNITLQD